MDRLDPFYYPLAEVILLGRPQGIFQIIHIPYNYILIFNFLFHFLISLFIYTFYCFIIATHLTGLAFCTGIHIYYLTFLILNLQHTLRAHLDTDTFTDALFRIYHDLHIITLYLMVLLQ